MSQTIQEESKKIQLKIIDHINACFESQLLPTELADDIMSIVSYYCPLKERSFLLKLIVDNYNLPISKVTPLLLGVEITFIAYYLRDDILDNGKIRLGNRTLLDLKGKNYANLVADLILEIGYNLINEYFHNIGKFKSSNSSPFISLIVGQCFSEKINKFEDLRQTDALLIARLKSGDLFKKMVLWLSHLIQKNIDIETLSNISYKIGTLIQIRNDIEDFIQDSTLTQQPVLTDLLGGKSNYLLVKYSEKCTKHDDDYNKLLRYWGNKNIISPNEIQDEVYSILENLKIVSDAILFINNEMKLIEKDIDTLNNKKIKKELKKFLKLLLTII